MAKALGVLILAAGVACRREEPRPRAAATVQATAAIDAAVARPSPTPLPPVAPGFAGSKRCLECHGKKAGWIHDWHARALSPATRETAVGRFDNAHFRGASNEAWMRRDGAAYIMRTGSADGVGDHRVDWLIGGRHMQDTVTVFPDGRWQVLPVYWHVRGGKWVDYTEDKQGALAPDHPFYWTNFRRTANRECLDCHVTGLQVHYDRGSRRFTTSFADAGVGCESCHGAGAQHADSQEPADIVNPAKLAPAERLAVCGSCHGPREPLFPLFDAARRYRPGERYDDHYAALVVVDGLSRSGDFFADGRPKTSSYELQALLQSRCHRKGGAECLSCHSSPHAAAPRPDELRAAPDETCRGCHAPLFAPGAAARHSRHAGAVACVDCHMPAVVTGVLDSFADHAIDVPVPENSARHHVPNACNACHAHATEAPAATAAALARLWPGAAARQARRVRLADAIDEATAAASQPALTAVIADPDEAPTLRGAAVLLLAQRFPSVTFANARALIGSDDALLRQRAAEALGDAQAGADLLFGLTRDPSLAVRQAAVLSLSRMRDPRVDDAAARLAADPAGSALPQAHLVVGLAAIARGDLPLAEREVSRALDLAPYRSDALVALAFIAGRRKDAAAERAALEEALRFDPRNAIAKRRLEEMGR